MAVLPPLNEGTGGLGTDVGIGPLSVWPGVASIVGGAWRSETARIVCRRGDANGTQSKRSGRFISVIHTVQTLHPSVQGWTLDTGPVLCDASASGVPCPERAASRGVTRGHGLNRRSTEAGGQWRRRRQR